MKFALFFIKVFNQTASSFLHFIQTALKSDPVRGHIFLALPNLVVWVLGVPHVVRYEFFKLLLPCRFEI
jgi:hypothetical protein